MITIIHFHVDNSILAVIQNSGLKTEKIVLCIFSSLYIINPSWAGLGESRRAAGGGTSRPAVKKHATSENFCPFYMKFCTYTVLTMWNKSNKKIDKCHHESHVLTVFQFFRN